MAYEDRLIRDIADYSEATLEGGSGLINGQIGITSDTKRVIAKDESGDVIKCATLSQNAEFLNLITDDIFCDDALIHYGDNDTNLQFLEDYISLTAGGIEFIRLEETSQDLLTINSGGYDVDFLVNANGKKSLFSQGSSGFIAIGDFDTPLALGHIRLSAITGTPAITAGTVMALEATDTAIIQLWASTARAIQFGDAADNREGSITCVDGAYLNMRYGATQKGEMNISATGLYIGDSSDGAVFNVHINAGATEGTCVLIDNRKTDLGIAVLQITQFDQDEPFIKLRGWASDNDITGSLVAVADVATFTVVGYEKIEVQDDGNQITDGDYYRAFGTLTAPE